MVWKVEYVSMEFKSKPRIPYENGGPIALSVNGEMVVVDHSIGPLPEVERVKTIVV